MDVIRIINSDGYKREDLNDQHRLIMAWLDNLIEDIRQMAYDYEDEKTDTMIEKMVKEIKRDTIKEICKKAEITIAEYQIAFAESEEEEDV